jgi:hypothetical protein
MCCFYVFPLRTSEFELVSICKTCYSKIPYMCKLYSRIEAEWKFCGSLHFFKLFKRRAPILKPVFLALLTHTKWTGIPRHVQWPFTGWTVRWSNPGGGRDFPRPSRLDLLPTQCFVQRVSAHFPGGKEAGTRNCPPTPSSAKVKERVEVYLHSPSGLFYGEYYLVSTVLLR